MIKYLRLRAWPIPPQNSSTLRHDHLDRIPGCDCRWRFLQAAMVLNSRRLAEDESSLRSTSIIQPRPNVKLWGGDGRNRSIRDHPVKEKNGLLQSQYVSSLPCTSISAKGMPWWETTNAEANLISLLNQFTLNALKYSHATSFQKILY